MGYTTPPTFVALNVLGASQLNVLGQDIIDLDLRTRAVTAPISTSETTTSTSYTDLATLGPTVSLLTGTAAVVMVQCSITGNTVAAGNFASVAVTGASTQAATDLGSVSHQVASGSLVQASAVFLISGLTPGTNTFRMKYRVSSGTGTFANRILTVWPAANIS